MKHFRILSREDQKIREILSFYAVYIINIILINKKYYYEPKHTMTYNIQWYLDCITLELLTFSALSTWEGSNL